MHIPGPESQGQAKTHRTTHISNAHTSSRGGYSIRLYHTGTQDLLLKQTFHGGEALDEPSALIRDLDIFDFSRFMTLYNRCHFT